MEVEVHDNLVWLCNSNPSTWLQRKQIQNRTNENPRLLNTFDEHDLTASDYGSLTLNESSLKIYT